MLAIQPNISNSLGMSNLSRVEALTREVPAPESNKTSKGQLLYVAVMVQGVEQEVSCHC